MWIRPLLFACVILPLASLAQTSSTITVSGVGSSVSTPDQFTFTAIVEEQGPSVSKLQTLVASTTNQIVGQLISAGVEEKNIQSMHVSLSPWYERTPAGSRQNGFVLTRQVNVTVKELSTYASIIDSVLKAGAARLERFRFAVSDPEQDYQLALQRAVQNARQRAQVLADQAGIALGNVISITEQGAGRPAPIHRQAMMAQEMNTDLPGQIATSSAVQVVFATNDKPN